MNNNFQNMDMDELKQVNGGSLSGITQSTGIPDSVDSDGLKKNALSILGFFADINTGLIGTALRYKKEEKAVEESDQILKKKKISSLIDKYM